jgi:hypothetical protein
VSTLTLEERMNLMINEKINKTSIVTNNIYTGNIIEMIKSEMEYFEAFNVRGEYLEKAFDYLVTIKPTSVESERAFSAAGLFCSKIRSRLNDESLDALCFLKAHFLRITKEE